MANTILLKKSGTANAIPLPGDLALGEVALNYTDGNLFYKDGGGTVNLLVSNKFVSVTGNITGGNLNATSLSLSGNVVSSLNSTANITTTANITGGNLFAGSGVITTSGNITGGNVNAAGLSLSGNVVSQLVSAANITTTANIAANYFIGNGSLLTGIDATSIQNGNSNVKVYANANVATSVNGVANVLLVTDTGVNITGTASANGNVTGGNLITAGAVSAASVSASANITGGNLISSGDISATSAANVQFGASTVLRSGNTTLNANGVYQSSAGNSTQIIQISTNGVANGIAIGTDGDVNSSILSSGGIEFAVDGTLVANGIPGAGNLIASITNTGLEVVGLISATGNVIAGNITTSGAGGNISGANVISGTTFSATGNITGGNLNAGSGVVSTTGNIIGGNLNAAGLSLSSNVVSEINSTSNITTTANISGGNVLTGGAISAASVSASGNITGGNVITSGGNISGANVISGTTFSATGNITGGNLLAGSGIISTGGNITGGNLNAAGLSLSGNVVSALVSAANITTTANIAANYFLGNGSQLTGIQASGGTANNIANGSSNVNIATSGGNITAAVGGTANVMVIATTGAYITGEISANGNVTGGNVLAGSGVISTGGNITGGNILTGGLISSTGNVTAGNLITSAAVSAASVSASANVTGGNLITAGAVSAASVSASANVTGGNINTAGLVTTANINSATTLTVTTAAGDINLWPTAGNVNLANTYINHVANPVQAQDAATKQYVDDAVSAGLTIHTPVYVEAPTALNATYAQGGTTFTVDQTIAGNTVVFTSAANLQVNDQLWFTSSFQGIVANTAYFVVSAPNTSAAVLSTSYDGAPVSNITSATSLSQSVRVNSGIGATLTNAGANAQLQIDGVTLTNTQRVLIYNQANAAHNGVYDVTEQGNATTAWQLTRSSNEDVYGPKNINELDAGDYFYVQAGSTGAGESYVMTAPIGPFIIGYDNLTFTQFSSSQVYSAGNGLSLTGTVFSVNVDNDTTAIVGGNVVVKTSANLVTPNIGAATGTSLSVTGNVTGGNLNATGLSLSGNVLSPLVSAANITTTGNISGGNIITSGASGNITGANVISGTTLSASGNVIGGNLNAAGLSLSSNVVSAINSTSAITTTANITGGNLNAAGLSLSGNVVSALNVTGNITGNNINGVTGVYSGGVQVLTINDTVDGGTY
jgi:hypothetical protein